MARDAWAPLGNLRNASAHLRERYDFPLRCTYGVRIVVLMTTTNETAPEATFDRCVDCDKPFYGSDEVCPKCKRLAAIQEEIEKEAAA